MLYSLTCQLFIHFPPADDLILTVVNRHQNIMYHRIRKTLPYFVHPACFIKRYPDLISDCSRLSPVCVRCIIGDVVLGKWYFRLEKDVSILCSEAVSGMRLGIEWSECCNEERDPVELEYPAWLFYVGFVHAVDCFRMVIRQQFHHNSDRLTKCLKDK